MMVVMVPARVDDADVGCVYSLAHWPSTEASKALWRRATGACLRTTLSARLIQWERPLSLCGGKYVVCPRSSRVAEAGSHFAKVQIPLQVVRSVGHGGVFKPEGFQNAIQLMCRLLREVIMQLQTSELQFLSDRRKIHYQRAFMVRVRSLGTSSLQQKRSAESVVLFQRTRHSLPMSQRVRRARLRYRRDLEKHASPQLPGTV